VAEDFPAVSAVVFTVGQGELGPAVAAVVHLGVVRPLAAALPGKLHLKKTTVLIFVMASGGTTMGFYRALDGVTNLKYRLLFSKHLTKEFSKRKALAFNRDRCWHLALCLRLILFHWCYRGISQRVKTWL
jgi:hypothetical protein